MDQLTPFEHALLAQFEKLARASEASLKQSQAVAEALSELSESIGERVSGIEQQQKSLTAHLDDLGTALTEQTNETSALVDAVNRLMRAQKR